MVDEAMTEGQGSPPNDDAYDPETGESKVWLDMISEAEKVFRDYQDKANAIDDLYANLKRLAAITRDREFQIFWSNIQVLAPSIYSRPPVPVVVPRFKDRRPLFRIASEFLERATNTAFDLSDIDSTMLLIRDDLAIQSRGCAWVRYETKEDGDSEKICIEHVDRKDFLHEPARNWTEVGWVARRCWMTMDELHERFKPTSGDAYLQAATKVLRSENRNGGATRQEKAAVWEIWSKTEKKVVWVTEGVEETLDEDKPHLKLDKFFPCPKPAYGTIQRGGLIPVPDYLMYKDQVEEVNALTNRIHALSEALRIKGFFPGGGEIGDAVEAALKINDDRKVMVPIANWAAFGGQGEQIIWLPIDMVANTVSGLVELRRAVIDDIYQITGLSDIMRGASDPNETLGAQQLKSQYGSVRVRDKQSELVRVARDLVRISAEIMAENFSQTTLMEMAQMDIPSDKDIKAQVKQLTEQGKAVAQQAQQQIAGIQQQIQQRAQQAQSDPQIMAQAQQDPQAAQQMIQQAQAEAEQASQQVQEQAQQQLSQIQEQVGQLESEVTIEQVMKFLHDNRIRPFVLDIETDSTIQPDENAEKQARGEFVQALAGLIAQFGPIIQQQPEMAGMVGELIKFALAPFRVGRELEGKIDEALEAVMAKAGQPQANPEQQKAEAEAQAAQERHQFDMEKVAKEGEAAARAAQIKEQAEIRKGELALQLGQTEAESKRVEGQIRLREFSLQLQASAQKHQQEMEKGQQEVRKLELQNASIIQKAVITERDASRNAQQSERSFAQQSALNAQKSKGAPK